MGNYMSSEPPKTDRETLHAQAIRGEEEEEKQDVAQEEEEEETGEYLEEELSFNPEGCEGGLDKQTKCHKKSEHGNMIARSDLTLEKLPQPWRDPDLLDDIKLLSNKTVRINVFYISKERPHHYPFSEYRGKNVYISGTGTADINERLLNMPEIDCPIPNCKHGQGRHKVTPVFVVITGKHVLFDDSEVQEASLDFFYDYEGASVVKAQILRIQGNHSEKDLCRVECVSHDTKLFKKILTIERTSRTSPKENPRPKPPHERRAPLVAIVSHPHACYKQISFGDLVGYGDEGNINDHPGFKVNAKAFMRGVEKTQPNFRESGFSFQGMKMSPYLIRLIEHRILQGHPDMTMKDLFDTFLPPGETAPSILPFITYTASTCGGSSGGTVFVYMEKEDGDWGVALGAAHFRNHRKRNGKFINASGQVMLNDDEFVSLFENMKASLRVEHRKSQPK